MIDHELTITLGHELNIITFENFLRNLLNDIKRNSLAINTIIFDGSKLEFIKLGGLICFLSLCGAIKEKRLNKQLNDVKIYFKYPSGKVMDHLHWMQFFEVSNTYRFIENIESLSQIDEKYYERWFNKLRRYKFENNPIKKKAYKAKVFPIRLIPPDFKYSDFESSCAKFINNLNDVLMPLFELDIIPKRYMHGFLLSNKELFRNIFDHSKSWGIHAVQVMRNSVVFSYSDIGIGIKGSLEDVLKTRHNLSQVDDRSAIEWALKKGVSSKTNSKENIGLGLYIVADFAKKTKGKMVIRSGKCLYHVNSKPEKVNYFPGTQIHIAIPKNY